MTSTAPIGVFDSGIGGLSVLRALRAELPHERFVYFADSAFAPYGEKGDGFVRGRSQAITEWLRHAHGIKALVVACNTATAAAIDGLRARHPLLPIIGVEPALKPAAAATRTGRVGVLATRGTVESARFNALLAACSGRVHFVVQPCAGLARAIEHSAQPGAAGAASAAQVEALCARYLGALGPLGGQAGAIDTLVLGCTHYVFALPVLRQLAGGQVRILETGDPVARHVLRLLDAAALLAPSDARGGLVPHTSGDPAWLEIALSRWLARPHDPATQVTVSTAMATAPGPMAHAATNSPHAARGAR